MVVTADTATYPGAGNAANQTSYATGSYTPVAGDLVIAIVGSSLTSGVPVTPTVTGNGQTWTLISTGIASSPHKVAVFYTLMTSPTTGAITFDYAGTTQQRAAWSVIGFRSNVGPMSWTNYNTDAANSTSSAATTTTATGAAGVWSGIYAGGAATAFTKDTNYTIGDNVATGAEAGRLGTQYLINSTSDLTANWSWATSGAYGHAVLLLLEPVPVLVIPATVTETFAAPTPTVTGEAVVTPAAVAATYTVDTPTVTGAAIAAPAAVAAVYTVPGPVAAAAGAGEFTNRGSGVATAATPTTATISATLSGGGVLWVVIGTRGTVTVPIPTVTMPGATFTLARSQARPEDDRRVSVYWSNDYDPGASQVLTITHGTTPTAVIWAAAEQTGVTLAGDPVAQSNSVAHTSSATPATTLSAGTGQMLVVACWSGSATATPEAPGTELFDLASGTTCMAGYWATAVDTTPAMTLSAASTTGFIAIETVMAGGGGAGTTVSPAAVAGVYTVDGPSSLAASTIIPATVVETFAVDTPTRLAASTVVPAAVAQVDTVPQPTVTVVGPPITVTPSETTGVYTAPAPSPLGAATVIPATVTQVDAAPTPTIVAGTGAVVTPATVLEVDTVPTPSPLGASTVTPAAVAAVDTVPNPSGLAASLVAPATVLEVDTVPGPSLTAASLVTPATVLEVDTVPTPALVVGAGAIATPAVVAAPYITDTPSVIAASVITPAAVLAPYTVPGPVADTGVTTGFVHRAGSYDSTYNTFSYNLTIPGNLVGGGVLWVSIENGGKPADIAVTPVLSMTGATFTEVRSDAVTYGSQDRRLTVWYSQDYDAGAGQVLTVTTSTGNSQIIWSVDEEVDGYTAGSPVVQSNSQGDTAPDKTTSTTLASGTGRLFAAGWIDNSAFTDVAGTTELSEEHASGPAGTLGTYWSSTMQTTPTFTWVTFDSSSLFIAVEVTGAVIPVAGTANPPAVNSVHAVPTPQLVVPALRTPVTVLATYTVDTPTVTVVAAALVIPGAVTVVYTVPTVNRAGAVQTLRPVTDLEVGVWTTDTGATTGLAAALFDMAESNYIQSETDPVDSPYATALEPALDPETSNNHVVAWSHRNTESGDIDLTTELRQGYVDEASPGSLIASWVEADIPSTFTTVTKTLTGAEADLITDYTALAIRFVATEAGFDPLALSGLTAWYDASQLALADGADVTSWPDLSGAGHGLTPLTSGKPTYQTSELNGLGVVRYGGVTDEHLVTSVGGDYRHFFLVAKYDLTTFASYNGLLGGDADLVLVGSGGTDIWYSYLETEYRWNGVVGTMRPAPMGVWGQMGVTKTAGWLNLKVWIGSDRGFAGRQWDGDVAEVIGYNRILSDSERLQVEAYLADKWGL